MKKWIAAFAATAVAALAGGAGVASADSTTQFGGGLNCSVTAFTPAYAGAGSLSYTGGVSCGGSQAGYSKNLAIGLWQLVSGGWQRIKYSGYVGWTGANPDRVGSGAGCVPGRWYATEADGQVSGGGLSGGASAITFNSGYQCH
jgi:hypothetical protein